MEHGDAENHDWPMQRRVEGIVSQHMADIALETLQQRLTAVSEEVHSLAQHVSRRSGEEFKDEPRRGDLNFGVEPPLSSACNPDKLLSVPSTAHTMTLSCPPSLVYCEDSDVLQKAYEQIANLKEDIHRLSAELEMKDLQLAGFTNHLPTLSRFILNSAEQSSKPPPNNDTELWDPSSACPRPTCSTPWTEVAVRGRKKDANSVPSPPSISTSNCYDLLYIVDFPAPPDLAAVHSIPPRPVQDAAPAVTTAAYHPCLVYPDCNTSHHYPKRLLLSGRSSPCWWRSKRSSGGSGLC
ncbi:uncharacterized protein si:dkey-187a12.4 isoform X1 [Epinephelus fuscoguttatus]|uniref:uncharacterized protein si:dkey-187a12.4 isoform X1 n=1 Tax=Epinephelus fuscoguttatus TaxID=293821 RepID=UPI0020D03726|nr:uncharacterized protein si:dkey-187a12.4 isoform X1 [Epinephelus fuscoguttatus]